jgi:hypothetical protein
MANTPEDPVEQEDHHQVDRKPGSIEEGEGPVAGQELAHRGQVVQGLAGVRAAALQVALEGRGVDALVQPHVQPGTDTDQHEAANELEPVCDQVGAHDHQREHQQRGLVAAGQHAVVDLQHVDRGRQHQHVDHGAEHTHAAERRRAIGQRVANLVVGQS